jgi:hypothetical protein
MKRIKTIFIAVIIFLFLTVALYTDTGAAERYIQQMAVMTARIEYCNELLNTLIGNDIIHDNWRSAFVSRQTSIAASKELDSLTGGFTAWCIGIITSASLYNDIIEKNAVLGTKVDTTQPILEHIIEYVAFVYSTEELDIELYNRTADALNAVLDVGVGLRYSRMKHIPGRPTDSLLLLQ